MRTSVQSGAEIGAETDGGGLAPLMPHRPPMVLIDGIEKFDFEERSLTAVVKITPSSQFFSPGKAKTDGGVPSWAALEYMAQAAAALSGSIEKTMDPEAQPRPGLLLGTRRLSIGLPFFREGEAYRVCATMAYFDEVSAAFDCKIADGAGSEVASAIITAFRPPDFRMFLES